MKYLWLIIIIPLFLFVSAFLSLVLGSLIRYINEGKNFKSPLDDKVSYKEWDFWKTMITGLFVYISLLSFAYFLRRF